MVKILLKRDVPHLGKAGEMKVVADGYARNYLIPQGMAMLATQGILKQTKLEQQMKAQRQAQVQQRAQELVTTLSGLTLTFYVRAGEKEQLYGSVTKADIAEALEAKLGRGIDRRKIELEEPIRRLGSYRVPIRLSDNSLPHIGVVVQREEE